MDNPVIYTSWAKSADPYTHRYIATWNQGKGRWEGAYENKAIGVLDGNSMAMRNTDSTFNNLLTKEMETDSFVAFRENKNLTEQDVKKKCAHTGQFIQMMTQYGMDILVQAAQTQPYEKVEELRKNHVVLRYNSLPAPHQMRIAALN
jgi:hypothetical protein